MSKHDKPDKPDKPLLLSERYRPYEPLQKPTSVALWWLSFADPALPKGEQFLGVVLILNASHVNFAIEFATRAGLNPGGQVSAALYKVTEPLVIEIIREHTRRVLTKAETDELNERIEKALESVS